MQHTAWSAKQGVIGEVLAIAQTSDGFLWIGTTGGLLRFDGTLFERYQPEIGAFPNPAWVSALLPTPDGGLWIGNLSGGASFLLHGKLTNYTGTDGPPPGRIRSFALDADGKVWGAAAGGLGVFDGHRWRRLGGQGSNDGIPPDPPSSVAVDRAGVWVAYAKAGIFLKPPGARSFQRISSLPVDGYLPTFADVVKQENWLWTPETKSLTRLPLPALNSPGRPTANSAGMFLVDHDGSGWMMTRGDGIFRVPSAANLPYHFSEHAQVLQKFTENDGLTNNTVYCSMEDHEGNVWVGTLGGLDRFRIRNAAWKQLQPIPTQRMQLVESKDGSVWASSPEGLWDVRTGKPVPGRPPNIHFLFSDPLGSIWLWSERGLSGDPWRWQNGLFSRTVSPSRYNSTPAADKWVPAKGPIRALARDGEGDLFVSIRGGGVFRLHDGAWSRIEVFPDAAETTAYGAVSDQQGRVWLSYPERKQVAVWDHGAIHVFTARDGLNIGAITQLACIDGQVWAGGESGLVFYSNGSFHSVRPAADKAFGLIAGITGSSQSGLWLSTTSEIIHIPQVEVVQLLGNSQHAVQYERFDPVSDLAELPSATSDTPAVMGPDGILWVATARGVIRLDPAHIHQNVTPPQVAIRNIVANDRVYPVQAPVVLPPKTTHLSVGYSVLSFSIPERVRSRYRLLGYEKEWRSGGNRVDAEYRNIGPGHYTFEVMGRNNDGVWSDATTTREFVIKPAFYQTIWFKLLYIISGLGLLWVMYSMRLRQITARVQSRYAERLAERTRIARELHDTLLQSLAGVSLQLDGIAKQAVSRPEKLGVLIDQVREMVDVCFVEARTQVWTLRSTSLEGPGLATTLEEFCKRIALLTGAGCVFHMAGEPESLAPQREEELLRIAQEAVHNAVRHAQASLIEVRLVYRPKTLSLTVSDNGRGFDVKEGLNKADHWGLRNMQERATLIDAAYTLSSTTGVGTTMNVIVRSRK